MARRLALRALVAALLVPAAAAAGTIRATLESKTLKVGQATSLSVEIRAGSAGRPSLNAPAGLAVQQIAVVKDQGMERGRLVVIHQYVYRITALEPGTWSLGPVKAELDGQSKASETYEIEVSARASGTSRSSRTGRTSRDRSRRGGQSGARGGDYYAIASISEDTPYIGQSVVYEVEIGRASSLRTMGRDQWTAPDWPPLSLEPGVDIDSDSRQAIIESRRYTVSTIRVPLFPLETERVEIAPSEFEMTVVRRGRGLVSRGQELKFGSNGVVVRARTLPTAGRPDDFGGLVGLFGLEASVDRARLETGETATLSVRVQGRGALRGHTPQVQVPDGLKLYAEQPDGGPRLVPGEGVLTDMVFRFAVVPLEPGTWEVPAIDLVFFDPDRKEYRRASTQAVTLTVTGEPIVDSAVVARSASLTTAREEVEVLGADILPLHDGARMLGDRRASVGSPLVLALLLLPLIGFGGLAARASGQRFAGTAGGQRRARGRAARDARADARKAAKEGDAAAAERALRAWLSARLERSGGALSPDDGEAVLLAAGAPPEVAGGLGTLLTRIEAVRYGGASGSGLEDEIATWLEQAARRWS